ncbi:MAG: hypothetical protein M1834_008415 [Cirrosporium novae-zelandiae]|nr:MAG: hypothetical protein M1834_008415 [Cirrosporium novae-zelandiae]
MAEEPKPTFHHLSNSQSQRILWLLSELGIDYNLVLHQRQPSGPERGRAPPELKDVHPLGKSPVLVTSQGRVITESSAIASYLIDTYDTSKRFRGDDNGGKNDWIQDEILTSFAGSSLGPMTTIQIFCDIIVQHTLFFLRPVMRLMVSGLWRAFVGPEMKKMLTFLNDELEGQEYFMGKQPGRADFMLSWPLDMIAQRKWLGDLQDWPRVKEWRERCLAREGWKEGMRRGNSYDLTKL